VATHKLEERRLDPGRIARSLNRSEVRREIHLHLCGLFPKGESATEISETTGYDERSVIGALIGDGDRYKPEDSLVTVGLVTVKEEKFHGQNVMIFSATSNGNDVDELLRNYARHDNLLARLKEYVKKLEGKKWKKQ
jgi:predicted transcriptional regulator with HTH domain